MITVTVSRAHLLLQYLLALEIVRSVEGTATAGTVPELPNDTDSYTPQVAPE